MSNRLANVRNVFGAVAAAAISSRCSSTSGGSQLGPASVPISRIARTVDADYGRSWIAPDAKNNDLLYIADAGTNDVYVYSWPEGKLKGTLTGFSEPEGECVDKVATFGSLTRLNSDILEYAHGSTSPIATLSDPNQFPADCSVDATTGNLAVSNIEGTGSSQGSVSIYTNARGTPRMYTDPAVAEVYFLGYDSRGDLFLDGVNFSAEAFLFAELPKGSGTLTNITLDQSIQFPAAFCGMATTWR